LKERALFLQERTPSAPEGLHRTTEKTGVRKNLGEKVSGGRKKREDRSPWQKGGGLRFPGEHGGLEKKGEERKTLKRKGKTINCSQKKVFMKGTK